MSLKPTPTFASKKRFIGCGPISLVIKASSFTTNGLGLKVRSCQGIRRCGLRQSRYVGLAKTHLPQVATATQMRQSDSFAKLLKRQGFVPRVIVTDQLRSVEHRFSQGTEQSS